MRLITLIIAIVFLIYGCTKDSTPVQPSDLNEDLKKFNSMTEDIRDVNFPEMRHGATKSSMEYSKPHNMRFSSYLLARKEIEAAADERSFWFWSRSFDKEHLYHCSRGSIENTRIRPELYPCILRGLFCSDPIVNVLARDGNSVFLTSENGMSRLVEMNEGRIIFQEFSLDNNPVVSMRFIEFQEVDGKILPKKVKIKWHNHDKEITLDMGKAILNSGSVPSVEMPDGVKRINLDQLPSP